MIDRCTVFSYYATYVSPVSQMFTDNSTIGIDPIVITYCPPLSIIVHFQSTFRDTWTTNQF